MTPVRRVFSGRYGSLALTRRVLFALVAWRRFFRATSHFSPERGQVIHSILGALAAHTSWFDGPALERSRKMRSIVTQLRKR